MSVSNKVAAAIANGVIPPEFIEEHRLLPHDHPATKQFSETMHRIHERIVKGLKPSANMADYPLQFMVSAEKAENAFIVTHGNKPLVSFSTQLIQNCKNESELAGVLVHELGHDYFKKLLGAHENGFLEELGSDLASPYVLRKAGYPMDGLRQVIQRFPDDELYLPRFLGSANDPHPTKATRVSSLMTAERTTVRGAAGMGEQTKVMDAAVSRELKQAAAAATFTSHMDALFAARGFAAATTEAKAGILSDIIRNELPNTDSYFESRFRDVMRKLETLDLDPGRDRKAIDALLEVTLEQRSNDAGDYYRGLLKAMGITGHELPPVGRMEDLQRHIDRFVSAATPEEMKHAARTMNASARALPFGKKELLDRIDFTGFKMPENHLIEAATHANPLKPQWDAHVLHAIESKDSEVIEALARLGIGKDPRLQPHLTGLDAYPVNKAQPQLKRRYIGIGEGARSGNFDIIINESGQIAGLKDMSKTALYTEELALKGEQLAARATAERELVKTVNWNELEHDFQAFTNRNFNSLKPEMTLVAGEHPFAERFVEECRALIKKDPEKFRPLVGSFFSGAKPATPISILDGIPVKQAIESHPDTPAHLKAEFKTAKTMAKDPSRHEWLDWVAESNANCLEHERIKPGRVLGAGSYGFTVEGTRPDGSKVARTILYPYVREKAENEFGILMDATENLIARDAKFAPVQDMIRQAQRMSGIETDMDIAARQAKAASQLYDGLKITANGQTYTFSAAEYKGHGLNHKDFEIIEGLHFNDLAASAKTTEEIAHVKGLAKASMAAELFNILGGRPFDHDRHGGQQKIVGNHIGQFDFGAMTVTEMSAREKQMIGHVMGGTIKQHYTKGIPIAEALRKEIKRVGVTEAERDFLACVERGVLALGNFQTHLTPDEVGEVIASVFANNKADPASVKPWKSASAAFPAASSPSWRKKAKPARHPEAPRRNAPSHQSKLGRESTKTPIPRPRPANPLNNPARAAQAASV